ncbi:MAG: hypothetical protein ACOCQR_00420 [bacterium]
MDFKEIEKKLKAPFPSDKLTWSIDPKTIKEVDNRYYARVFATIDAKAIRDRLDEVLSPFYWQVDFKEGQKDEIICELGIYVEDISDWVWRRRGMGRRQFDTLKEPDRATGNYTSAFRTSALWWGLGSYLEDLGKIFVQINNPKEQDILEDPILKFPIDKLDNCLPQNEHKETLLEIARKLYNKYKEIAQENILKYCKEQNLPQEVKSVEKLDSKQLKDLIKKIKEAIKSAKKEERRLKIINYIKEVSFNNQETIKQVVFPFLQKNNYAQNMASIEELDLKKAEVLFEIIKNVLEK